MATTNPLINIYSSIHLKLRELPEPPKCFDVELGQFDEEGLNIPVEYPAVFLKFEDIIWNPLNEEVDIGIVNITVKTIWQFTKDNELLYKFAEREEVIQALQYAFDVDFAINQLNGESFSRLKRFNQFQETSKPQDLTWTHVVQYQCNIQSNSAIDNPDNLILDYDLLKNNNSFMERKKYNLLNK